MRVVARVVTAALAAGLLLAPGASAAKPKRSLTVGLVSKSQDKLLRANRVTASVYSKRRGRVRVTAVARSTASRGHGRRVAVTRVVAFRKAGRKHVTLKLTATGRRVLSACGGRRMVLGARLKGARRSVTASDVLRIDRGACQTQTTADITTRNADRCDYLDPSYCLYPWPNDFFTKPDESTPTGERLNLNRQSTPANTAGVHIDPSDQNRADGFSPGNLLVTHVPGMDNQEAWQRTGAVPITDIARYADTDQPVVVINADTGRRQPIWTELDVNATEPSKANLIIRPARNWDEGARYLVALRNLKTKDGKTIDPQPEFRAFRDRLTTKDAAFEARRAHMEDVIGRLAQAGIARDDLYLAWDFTVASEKSLAGRMLKIRDDAFAQLGDTDLANGKVDGSAPNFVVTKVDDLAPCGSDGCQSGEDDKIGRRVTGNILVPCYLDAPGCPPGSRFNYAGSTPGVPAQLPGNTALAPFVCDIPRQQTDSGAPPARPSLYGHGLLGSADEVNAGNVESMAQEHNFVFCATDWAGMSQSDIPNVAHLLIDLSDFPTLADRTQQGMLNFLYLGRAMVHPQGFDANP
ncbi:MAG: hypothetical protein QOJ07_2756, partial [Thermoleophilaceae bacterium]|nr:hypothetical protein [Thermoleophilaceae bacterium]